jgi:hypothetical protein
MVSMQSAGYRIITVVLKMQLLIIQLIVQGTKGFLCRFVKHMLHHQARNHSKQFEAISTPEDA